MTTKAAPDARLPASERDVVAHLLDHADFLERHPEVLEHLRLRHEAGRAVSLIERQVDILRARNQQLQGRLTELLETARENETRVWHLNTLARALLKAESSADIMAGLTACLKRDFGVDVAFLGVKGDAASSPAPALEIIPPGDTRLSTFDNFFRLGQVVCGPLSADHARQLFPGWDHKAAPLASAALVPLGKPVTRGMLALASREAKRFEPDMGTLFLELLADLVAAGLRRELG